MWLLIALCKGPMPCCSVVGYCDLLQLSDPCQGELFHVSQLEAPAECGAHDPLTEGVTLSVGN